jgi:hypothetical protein
MVNYRIRVIVAFEDEEAEDATLKSLRVQD